MMEPLDVAVKGMSDSLEGRMADLEAKMQTRWVAF